MDPDTLFWRRSGRGGLGLIVAFVVVSGLISIINPLFEASDEIRHYRYTRILVTEHRLPVQGAEVRRAQSHHPPLYYFLSAAVTGWLPSSHDGTLQQPGNPFWGYRNWSTGVDNKLQYWHSSAQRFPYAHGYVAAGAARWVNVLLGAATVWATYVLALAVFQPKGPQPGDGESEAQVATPSREGDWAQPLPRFPGAGDQPAHRLALASAAIVALNPQFIYQSAAISNDIVAALLGTALLVAVVRSQRKGHSTRRLIGLGVVAGLALLSKLQVAALGPAVALGLAVGARPLRAETRSRWGLRLLAWARALLIVGVVAGAVCGWWYARNAVLYRDITGMRTLDQMWAGRDPSQNLWAIGQGLPQLWASLWGRFGYGQIPLPGHLTTGLLVFCCVALAGLLRPRQTQVSPGILATLMASILCLVAVVLYYMARQPAGAMGRFLFPVLPAFAVVVTAGLNAWLKSPAKTSVAIIGAMAVFAAVSLLGYLLPAVTYPRRELLALGDSAQAIDARVGDVARLLSVGVEPVAASPGDAVFVRLNWAPLRWTDEPLTVFVHAVDEAGAVVAQRDTWPGLGRAPTTSWRAGVPFVDTVRVDLPEALYTPSSLSISIGVYGSTVGRLPIEVSGVPAVNSLNVGTVSVPATAGAHPNPIDVSFEGVIHLVGYEMTPRALVPGDTVTLTTVWDVATPPTVKPHIFAQVLGEDWRVWGSNDGNHPAWTTGIVTDTRQITLIPETPHGSYPVNVGLVADGERLRIVAENGTYLGDHTSLGPIGVSGK